MSNDAVELSFFSSAVLRRWYLPVGLALLGLVAGFVLRPAPSELNEARTKVLIRPVTDSVLDSSLRVDQLINEDTETEIAGSDLVARSALERLGDDVPADLDIDEIDDNLTVTVRTDSQIVVVKYGDEDPDVAAAVADAIAAAYLDARSNAAVAERDRQATLLAQAIAENTRDLTQANLTIETAEREAADRSELESRIARLEEQVALSQLSGDENDPTGDPITPLRNQLSALPDTVSPAELASARTSRDLTIGQIADLRDSLVSLSTLEIDGGVILEQARPGEPVTSTTGPLIMAILGFAGLLLGFVLAVGFERSAAIRRAGASADGSGGATSPPPGQAPDAPGSGTIYLGQTAPQFTFESPAPAGGQPEVAHSEHATHAGVPAAAGTAVMTAPAPAAADSHTEPSPEFVAVAPQPIVEPEPPVQPEYEYEPEPEYEYEPAPEPEYEPEPEPEYEPEREPEPEPEPEAIEVTSQAPAVDGLVFEDAGSAAPAHPTGLPVLADIPKISRSALDPIVATDPSSEPATALRRLAGIVIADTAGLVTPSVMITSARPEEGRSTVASNIATALRLDGHDVILVTDSYESVIAPGVHVLPPGMRVGPDDRFPDEERFTALLEEARQLVDVVIIDGPPMLTDAEAVRVAALCDRALLVGLSGRTTTNDVTDAARLIQEAGTKVIGLATTVRPSWIARRFGDRSVG